MGPNFVKKNNWLLFCCYLINFHLNTEEIKEAWDGDYNRTANQKKRGENTHIKKLKKHIRKTRKNKIKGQMLWLLYSYVNLFFCKYLSSPSAYIWVLVFLSPKLAKRWRVNCPLVPWRNKALRSGWFHYIHIHTVIHTHTYTYTHTNVYKFRIWRGPPWILYNGKWGDGVDKLPAGRAGWDIGRGEGPRDLGPLCCWA